MTCGVRRVPLGQHKRSQCSDTRINHTRWKLLHDKSLELDSVLFIFKVTVQYVLCLGNVIRMLTFKKWLPGRRNWTMSRPYCASSLFLTWNVLTTNAHFTSREELKNYRQQYAESNGFAIVISNSGRYLQE